MTAFRMMNPSHGSLLLFSEEFSHVNLGLEETRETTGMREEKIG